MKRNTKSKLSSKKRYLQIALNSTLEEAQKIISQMPISDRIIIEAGTPLIKRYGEYGIRIIRQWYEDRIYSKRLTLMSTRPLIEPLNSFTNVKYLVNFNPLLSGMPNINQKNNLNNKTDEKSYQPQTNDIIPYIVADLKMMDRGEAEVEIAARSGASGAVALGHAPIESLNAFIQKCKELEIDAIIDMMNVEYPLSILRKLKEQPRVVILHRGVDEEEFNKEIQIPLHEIRRIKGNYDILIAIAGGDTLREAQRAIFNDADIVIVWKSVFQQTSDTSLMIEKFLKQIK